MRLSTEADMKIENQEERENPAMPDSGVFLRNIYGAILILAISLAVTLLLLRLSVAEMVDHAINSENVAARVSATAEFLLAAFLIGFPIILLVQSLVDYRTARRLERLGLATRGTVLKKWVEASTNGKPLYYVQYKYLTRLIATQIVDVAIFEQMQEGENVFILYLEEFPHISRLDLD
jgi:hypothetical protein